MRISFPSSGGAGSSLKIAVQSCSAFHGNAEPLYFLVFSQSRTENRFALFLELL
jgi:hypothetical protein